ncbi:hypothetical protein TR51_35585 [Kitasatospora griseola]|uniref:Uncharacterized protein n=1 Tax=Kitasatospora griseola TaxID=2064 RepID=A0A0D0PS64_KITGR|nr:hypothetical protein TR51_35585 [Kitasatospora griseola]
MVGLGRVLGFAGVLGSGGVTETLGLGRVTAGALCLGVSMGAAGVTVVGALVALGATGELA